MQINGLENISPQQLDQEIARGAKFVVFDYCISLLIITFRRSSGVYFIRADESAIGKSAIFTLLTLVLGWWGIPWGPIFSIGALFNNLKGGKDVTMEIMNSLNGRPSSTNLI